MADDLNIIAREDVETLRDDLASYAQRLSSVRQWFQRSVRNQAEIAETLLAAEVAAQNAKQYEIADGIRSARRLLQDEFLCAKLAVKKIG